MRGYSNSNSATEKNAPLPLIYYISTGIMRSLVVVEALLFINRIVPVDATGAGDQFAAGFLYGYATGQSLEIAGRMGCVAAAEVISHYGARPETDLKALFRKAGLL